MTADSFDRPSDLLTTPRAPNRLTNESNASTIVETARHVQLYLTVPVPVIDWYMPDGVALWLVLHRPFFVPEV